MMLKKIIVPLDGSELAEKALHVAVTIARRTDATLVVVRVVEANIAIDGAGSGTEMELLTDANTYIDDVVQIMTTVQSPMALASEQIEGLALYGTHTATLLDTISAENADLVVMTSHARGGFSRFVMGSTATNIVRRANVPVVVLHPERGMTLSPTIGTGAILVALDGTPEVEAILEPAITLAQALALPIHLVQVVVPRVPVYIYGEAGAYAMDDPLESPDQARERALAYLDSLQVRLKAQGVACTTTVRLANDVVSEIAEMVTTTRPAMVAMATHARGRVGEVVLGSIADALLRGLHLPVLLVHTPTQSTLPIAPATATPFATAAI